MKIVNVVATVELSSQLDLKKIASKIEGATISPPGSWVKYRLAPEGYYIAFFRSGKILLTGVVLLKKLEEITKRTILVLSNAGINVTIKNVHIHNIVATDKLDIHTTLENLIHELDPNKANYEPEQFPGLIYKDWGATFLLFTSGKTIIMGQKSIEETEKALKKFKQTIAGKTIDY